MKFQGDIASIPITDVIQNLSANRKSGVVTIRRNNSERQIILIDGHIVSYGDSSDFSIPRWFEDKQIIDPDIFKKAQKRYKRAKKKSFGEILHELGGIEHEEYLKHVKDIVLEMLYETFSFREGTFEFDETELDLHKFDREIASANLDMSIRSVIMEAARRMDDWEAIRRSLPSENDIYQIASGEMERLKEEFEEDPVSQIAIELLDGSRSIGEVIAAVPTGKFSASRFIADLVSKKLARPVDGDELVEQLDLGDPEEHSRALVRLKAALEREPGNQGLLLKVAELSMSEGNKDESATFYKLLAQSLYDNGELEASIKELRRSLDLSSKDIGTWKKLYDFTNQHGVKKEILKIGMEMVGYLRGAGLNELARDQLTLMMKKFSNRVDLRLEYSDTLFALGERTEAVKKLLDLARDLFQDGKQEEAEKTLAKVIEYDPNHKRAKEIYEKVRTGKLAKQRERRRVMVRTGTLVLFIAALILFMGYDLFARKEFATATREILSERLLERGYYQKAKQKIEAVKNRHPYSLMRFVEGKEIMKAIEENIKRKDKKTTPPQKRATRD